MNGTRQPPRFVPTLTEVVEPQDGFPALTEPEAAGLQSVVPLEVAQERVVGPEVAAAEWQQLFVERFTAEARALVQAQTQRLVAQLTVELQALAERIAMEVVPTSDSDGARPPHAP